MTPLPTVGEHDDACRAPLLQLSAHGAAGSRRLWFAAPRAGQAGMSVVREGADASGTVLAVRIEPDAASAQECRQLRQLARLWLDGAEVGACQELPCEIELPPVDAGAHSVDAAVSCGGAEATARQLFELRPQRTVAPTVPPDAGSTTAQQRRAAPWRAVADESGELWEHIRQQDALEYRARHRISPDEIAAPASCPAQSVCGVWAVEPAAAKGKGGEVAPADKTEASQGAVSACVDLCVGKVFLPPADALVRSREEAEDAAAFQQLLFDLQFPPPPPPPGGGRGAGGALADADGAARSEGSGDGGVVFVDGGGAGGGGGGGGSSGGGDSSTDVEASASGEATLLRPAASPLSGFGVTMVYAAHNLAKAASAARIWFVRLWIPAHMHSHIHRHARTRARTRAHTRTHGPSNAHP